MKLFSEIYNCYYQIVYDIITHSAPLTKQDMAETIKSLGYEESILYLLPKLTEAPTDSWNLFAKEDNRYLPKTENSLSLPLSHLQKSWLKALLLDTRIRLFLLEEQLNILENHLKEYEPLFYPQDFYYYDAFTDGDEFDNPVYREHFSILLAAIKKRQYVNLSFQSHHGHRVHHWFLPCKLEYSIKNNRFRLLALEVRKHSHYRFFTINLSRITEIVPLEQYANHTPDINRYIKKGYHKEPVTLLIRDTRNALERTMLQFANYEKNTTKVGEHLYQCEIFYNKSNETELLIEVLSFGPMVKVIGNAGFLKQLRERLRKQKELDTYIQQQGFPG